jgi:hypothetical protein
MDPFIPGMILPIDGGAGPVFFQWNPREITGPSASANWAAVMVAGREFPYLEYSCGQVSNIQFDLYYSTRSDAGAAVMAAFWSLNAMTTPKQIGASYSRPPIVTLRLGGFLNEKSVITEVSPNFIPGRGPEFSASLLPREAKIHLTFWRYKNGN